MQVVIGEVYNIASTFPGVRRAGDVLEIEPSRLILESSPVSDAGLDELVQRAQRRLQSLSAGSGEPTRSPDRPMFPNIDADDPGASPVEPKSDPEQRLTNLAAAEYRKRLERIAAEDLGR